MSRDYANRKPGGAKARQSKKKSTQGANVPFVPLVLVILLLAGFGYFLWSINGSAGDTPAATKAPKASAAQTKTTEKITEKAKPKKDPNALPPKPTEEWTYLKELENKSVEVDIPADAMVSAGPYQMQCGSFRQESQANQMKAMIAFQGINAEVRKSSGTNGIWYKVILGPYDNKRAAERNKHTLQNAKINGCQIWLWQ
ncbi:Sporulation related [Shewanella denitrificans OS217]|jgi:cell division protein FtsN|uniref:Sporulation related n=1 Tax=Shewanella denitrificans (strain OS217 / ATCC BAA-1090 / DSM 15013) TaxID=318161 RepID=Q12IU2_SHEDO|nr:SPOR domain-containing protein [Shewanella denitrificans]ABE56634.1 Sporulation related [Shewanella denitrificans OS217]